VIILAKKTTILIDDDIYAKLVDISIKKYGSARHLSRVINDLLSKILKKWESEPIDELRELLSGPKLAEVTLEGFEEFRKELSKRFEL